MDEQLQVGSKVLADFGKYSKREYKILTITRETKTTWFTDDGSKWTKDTRRQIPRDVWHSVWFEPLTASATLRYNAWKHEEECRSLWWKITQLSRPAHLTRNDLIAIYEKCTAGTEEKQR